MLGEFVVVDFDGRLGAVGDDVDHELHVALGERPDFVGGRFLGGHCVGGDWGRGEDGRCG